VLRPLLTFAAALILLLAAFFVFIVWKAQPNATTTRQTNDNQRAIPVTPGPSVIGNGTVAKWQQWKDGRLESEFSATEYTPNTDGSFEVTNPIDIFYMSDGQQLKVIGDTGHLNCETPAQTSLSGMTNTNMSPRNGWLQNVRLELYKEPDLVHPTLTMTTNNIHFDNDVLRIYTESFTDPITKQMVPADQVPVTIRGDEYEFDGNGLTLVWNGKTRRLQQLLVNHGKRLEIKNPTRITLPGMAPAQPPAKVASDVNAPSITTLTPSPGTPGGSPIAGRGEGGFEGRTGLDIRNHPHPNPLPEYRERGPEMLALSNRADVKLALNTKPAVPEPPTLYRAVFNDNVKISDEVRTLATADLMLVDFLQGSNPAKPATPVSTAAGANSSGSVATPASTAPPMGSPPAAPAGAATTAPTSNPTTRPATTKPINGPVTITWTGELLVTPLENDPPMMPIKPGQSVVRLVGTPAHLTPEGSEIWAARATYRSPDGAVKLESATDAPVKMNRANGQMTLDTRSIDFDPESSYATLHGESHLSVAVGKGRMNVAWQQLGKLHMVKQPGQSQPSGVSHVDLTGDVNVRHPQFQLKSQELQLDLLPTEGKPDGGGEQLKAVTADGTVECGLPNLDVDKIKQGINSDHLVIRTQMHNKQTVIRELVADGNVNAFKPDQRIEAGHLDAFMVPQPTTMPATNPADAGSATAVDLERLDASDHVHARLKNNATADADGLHISGSGKDQQISLKGAEPAILADGSGKSLAGRDILLSPATSGVKVNGPGTLKTPRRSATTQPATAPVQPAQPAKPIIVTWENSLNMLGNEVDVVGRVHVQNTDANGTFSDVTGDMAHLDLMDTPKDPKQLPTTTKSKSEDDSAIGGKQLKKLTLTGHIIGNSDLIAPDGSVLRQGRLRCDDSDQMVYTADNGRAIIHGPGRMFVENHLADQTDPSGNKGAMAISWQKQMVYDQLANTITFTGGTIVGFQQDPANGKAAKAQANGQPVGQGKMNLMADQVVITLASSSTTRPAAGPQQKMQVSKMQAMGSVRFIATSADMTCVTADYDPKTSILTAKGDDGQDVHVTTGNITGSFRQVQYDSAKQEIVNTTGSHIKTSN
jgi:hypothetical protein